MGDSETEKKTESILISLTRFLSRFHLFENIPVSDQVDIKKIIGVT
jgi:hypothetical protein